MLEHSTTAPAGQSVGSAELLDVGRCEVAFTHIVSERPVSKRWGVSADGTPMNLGGVGNLISGVAHRVAVRGETAGECMEQIAAQITGFGEHDLLIPAPPPDGEDSYRIVTEEMRGFDDTAISRTAAYFQPRPTTTLVLFDMDAKGYPRSFLDRLARYAAPKVWQALCETAPVLDRAARVSRQSQSAAIRNARTGAATSGNAGAHIFVLIADGTKLPEFARRLEARLMLAGWIFPFVSASGQLHWRTLIDIGAMKASMGLCYEGAPILEHPDLECIAERRQAIAAPGEVVDTDLVPPLTDEEERRLAQIKAEIRAQPEVQAEIALRKKESLERLRDRAPTKSLQVNGALLDHAVDHGELQGDYPVTLDDGRTLTVREILCAPNRFNKAKCPDPLEPDYGGGKNKAMIKVGPYGVRIDSFAHGGMTYRLQLSAEEWFDVLPTNDTPPSVLRPLAFQYRNSASIPPRQWLYAGHYIRGFFSVTVAPGGTGKTSFTMVEAIAMATGRQLLHYRPHRRCRVWLFNGEDPLEEIERRLIAICLQYGIDPAELDGWLYVGSGRTQRMMLANETRDGCLINEAAFEQIEAGIRELGIDVLIVDPLVSLHQIKESSNDGMGLLAGRFARLADHANIAVQIVHHVRKTGGAETTVEDSRGASALMDAARSGRALTRMTAEEGKRLQVENHRRYFRVGGDPKGNMAPPPADADTNWMELKSISLGNGTPDYPQGDSVGVVVPFKPVRTAEEIKEDAGSRERLIVARAVLTAADGETDVKFNDIREQVKAALHLAGVTKSAAPHVTRDKVTAALAGKDGMILDHEGQLVRLRAAKRGVGDTAPWHITLEAVSPEPLARDASGGVFA